MAAVLSDTQLLARLVSFDSVSSTSNLPIANFICDYVDLPDIEIVRHVSDDRVKVNLIIRVGGKRVDDRERGGLVLSGHTDVVPANEPEWESDPFRMKETDETFIGRGACDMKGFDALAINLARRACEWPLVRPLVLILTCDEEIGTLGASRLARTWSKPFPLPQNALIGEPTSLRVVRMHKGYVMMRVRFSGKSAHSGYPDLGINAIAPAGRMITALTELADQLRGERCESSAYFPEAPYPALNLATISGGSALNVVPDQCEVGLSARILPGMTSDLLISRVRGTVDRAWEACRPLPPDGPVAGSITGAFTGGCAFEVLGESPPLLTPESAAIYQALCRYVSQSETCGVSYATDAGPLQQLGLECVVFGPGNIEVAHKPNESLPKGEFVRAGSILERAVKELCGE